MDLRFLENSVFQTYDFSTASQPIQAKEQLLENFKSVFKFLAVADVEGINYAHQQGTGPWNILLNQTFGSFHDNCCHPVI